MGEVGGGKGMSQSDMDTIGWFLIDRSVPSYFFVMECPTDVNNVY